MDQSTKKTTNESDCNTSQVAYEILSYFGSLAIRLATKP